MNIQTATRICFQKYADFTGRARRAEYWWFAVAVTLVTVVLTIVDIIAFDGLAEDIGVFSTVFGLATMIPSFAVGARRLHDINRSGWWQLLWLVPIIGWVVLIYFLVRIGNAGDNQFGADPLA